MDLDWFRCNAMPCHATQSTTERTIWLIDWNNIDNDNNKCNHTCGRLSRVFVRCVILTRRHNSTYAHTHTLTNHCEQNGRKLRDIFEKKKKQLNEPKREESATNFPFVVRAWFVQRFTCTYICMTQINHSHRSGKSRIIYFYDQMFSFSAFNAGLQIDAIGLRADKLVCVCVWWLFALHWHLEIVILKIHYIHRISKYPTEIGWMCDFWSH